MSSSTSLPSSALLFPEEHFHNLGFQAGRTNLTQIIAAKGETAAYDIAHELAFYHSVLTDWDAATNTNEPQDNNNETMIKLEDNPMNGDGHIEKHAKSRKQYAKTIQLIENCQRNNDSEFDFKMVLAKVRARFAQCKYSTGTQIVYPGTGKSESQDQDKENMSF